MPLSGGLCESGFLPGFSPSFSDPHRKAKNAYAPGAGSTIFPHITWGFSPSAHKHPPRPSQQVAPTQHYTYTTALSGPWNWKPAGKPQWGRRRAGAMSSAGLHRAPPEPQPREPTCHATRFTSKSQTQATCILTAPPASAEIAEQHNDKQSQ